MSVLAPFFLAGLGVLLVPLLVHLVHKERKDTQAFPSFMFLKRTPYPFSARQRIRDWWLFALRCLLIALAAFAFARPVFARRAAATSGLDQGQEVVVLLDRSFSMRYGDRWAAAKREVNAMIGKLSTRDRMTLVAFDRRAMAVNEPTGDAGALRAALDTIVLTDEGTRLAPAIAVGQKVLGASALPRKRLVVISDFQRTSWDLTDELQLPLGTDVTPVDVGGATPVVDHAVRSTDIRRDPSGDGSRVLVSARLVNVGPAVRQLGVRLLVGGRTVDTKKVDLPRDGGATVVFAPVSVPGTAVPSEVNADADQLAGDDVYSFTLTRAPTVPVLLVEHRDATTDRGVFVSRALGIGDNPAFDVVTRRSDRVSGQDLVGRSLVVLADAGLPAGFGAGRLEAFVRAGGGLINVLGERTSARTWPAAAAALVPGTIAQPVDRLGEKGAVLGYVDRAHQALAVFGTARSGDLSAARFFRYRPIDTTDGVLARFDDGAAALTEHKVGGGRVLTWGSSLDGYWNDLPRQAVFLPFVHQLARYASAYREQRRAHAIGDAMVPGDLTANTPGSAAVRRGDGARWSVVSPTGRRSTVGGPDAPPTLDLHEAGIYQLRPGGNPAAAPRYVAANIASTELDFASFDVARLTNALVPVGADPTAVGQIDERESIVALEGKQSLWWYLLVVAAAILFVETLVAWRLGVTGARTT